MLKGGIRRLADSRLKNLERLRQGGIKGPLLKLIPPLKEEVEKTILLTEGSLVSSYEVCQWISEKTEGLGKKYGVILMVEMGEGREGLKREEIKKVAAKILKLKGIEIKGIGTNVACLTKLPPTPQILEHLVEIAKELETYFGIQLKIISGGNSSAWLLIEKGKIPSRINELRIGEAILLGQETIFHQPIPGTYQDAFKLKVEVLEVEKKAYNRKQALLAVGRQDLADGEVKPLLEGAKEIRRSSDHLIIDISHVEERVKVGSIVEFIPSYFAMLALMTSPFVQKEILEEK